MAENGATISEIQAQTGIDSVKVLLGYIQHVAERRRKTYDKAFGNINEDREINQPNETKETSHSNLNKYLDRKAVEREIEKKKEHKKFDMAYQ